MNCKTMLDFPKKISWGLYLYLSLLPLLSLSQVQCCLRCLCQEKCSVKESKEYLMKLNRIT